MVEQVAVQLRRDHVGQDAVAGNDRFAVGEHDARCAVGVGEDGNDLAVATDATTETLHPAYERAREVPRAAFRDGPTVLLSNAGEQPPEHAAQCGVGGDVGVEGRSGEQQPAACTAEPFQSESPDGKHGAPGQLRGAAEALGPRQVSRSPHRREGVEKCADQVVFDFSPLALKLDPRVPVAGCEALE